MGKTLKVVIGLKTATPEEIKLLMEYYKSRGLFPIHMTLDSKQNLLPNNGILKVYKSKHNGE